MRDFNFHACDVDVVHKLPYTMEPCEAPERTTVGTARTTREILQNDLICTPYREVIAKCKHCRPETEVKSLFIYFHPIILSSPFFSFFLPVNSSFRGSLRRDTKLPAWGNTGSSSASTALAVLRACIIHQTARQPPGSFTTT